MITADAVIFCFVGEKSLFFYYFFYFFALSCVQNEENMIQ